MLQAKYFLVGWYWKGHWEDGTLWVGCGCPSFLGSVVPVPVPRVCPQALRREVETLRAEREADAEALRTQEGAVAELREANARSEAEAERWRAAEQEARERADEV